MLVDRLASIEGGKSERRSPRERACLSARLVWGAGTFSADATVTQISRTGARLAWPGAGNLPKEFTIEIPMREMKRKAQTVWQDGAAHAIKFVDEAVARETPERTETQEKLRGLTEEVARLRGENGRLRGELQRLRGG